VRGPRTRRRERGPGLRAGISRGKGGGLCVGWLTAPREEGRGEALAGDGEHHDVRSVWGGEMPKFPPPSSPPAAAGRPEPDEASLTLGAPLVLPPLPTPRTPPPPPTSSPSCFLPPRGDGFRGFRFGGVLSTGGVFMEHRGQKNQKTTY